MRRDVFQAIADPTRRTIIQMVSRQSLNLNSVAEKFDVSRPAISKHIKILTECGLIVIRQQGRDRYCEAKLEKLNEVSTWVEQYREFWNTKLDAFELYLAGLHRVVERSLLHGVKKHTKQKNHEVEPSSLHGLKNKNKSKPKKHGSKKR